MRNCIRTGSLLLALSFVSLPVMASTWEIDKDHSEVGFAVKHLMTSHVHGAFEDYTATLNLDDKDISKSSVEVIINTSSLATHSSKRDEHLKSPDFFDAAKYPHISFKSTKVEKEGDNLKVSGNLTIKDITKHAVLTVKGPTPAIKDPFGNWKNGFAAHTSISRKDYNLKWNKALEAGGVLVSDQVDIHIQAEFARQDSPKPSSKQALEQPKPQPQSQPQLQP